jgi:hypothetical protein
MDLRMHFVNEVLRGSTAGVLLFVQTVRRSRDIPAISSVNADYKQMPSGVNKHLPSF